MLNLMEEKNIGFDPQRAPDISFVSRVIKSWNSNGLVVCALLADDTEVTKIPETTEEASNVIYIRLKGNRWEGCGYFQEPIATQSITQPSSTMSAISQVNIAPVTHTRTSSETFTPESLPSLVTERHKSANPTPESLHEVAMSLWMLIDMLPCWMEVLDFSSNESLRAASGIILSEATKLEKTLFGVLDVVRKNTTSAQKETFEAKWKAYDKQRWIVTQEEYEEAERLEKEQEKDKKHKQNKTRKQKQEQARKQKELEEARQRDREEVKQRERHASIRMNINNRWEGFGYFQDSISSASSLHASNKFSAISRIDIKPVIRTAGQIASSTLESALTAAVMDKGSLKSMVKLFRSATDTTILSIRMLYCWIEVLYAAHDQLCRPTVRHLSAAFDKLWKIVRTLEMRYGTGTTAEDKQAFFDKWDEHLKRERDEDIEQREAREDEQEDHEDVKEEASKDNKREQDENSKQQAEEDAKQKEYEEVEQREREEIKQREREEAKAIATAYAAQDRYDSCSDSD